MKNLVKSLVGSIIIFVFLSLALYVIEGGFVFSKRLFWACIALMCNINLYENAKNYLGLYFSLFMICITPYLLKVHIYETTMGSVDFTFVLFALNIFFIITVFLKQNKLLKYFLFPILFVVIFPAIIFLGNYFNTGTWITFDVVMAVAQTNLHESFEYLSDKMSLISSLLLAIFFIVFGFLGFAINKIQIKQFNKTTACVVVALVIVNLFGIYKTRKNVYTEVYNYYKDGRIAYEQFKQKSDERKNNVNSDIKLAADGEAGVYVLVIGESHNRSHMEVYGYDRNTNPWLNSCIKNPNFIIFNSSYSCYPQTVPALSYALTSKNQYNKVKVEEAISIIDVAKKAGYKTFWLSNQVKYGIWDTPTSVIADNADIKFWINNNAGATTETNFYDDKLLKLFDELDFSKKNLIVVHLIGCHASYAQRYPKEYNCYTGNTKKDKYDNAVRYNDKVMHDLLERLKSIPNFQGLFYFSDHGEDVDLGHHPDTYTQEMVTIPMYMYLSDDYIKQNKERYNVLRSSKNKTFTNDLVFNTMLGIMGIKLNSGYEEENDITSSAYNANHDRFRTMYGKKAIE